MKTQTLWDYAEVFAMEFEEAPHLIANLRSTKLRLVVDTPQFDLTVQFKIIISRKGERQMTLRFVTSPVTYPQFLGTFSGGSNSENEGDSRGFVGNMDNG